MNDLPVVSTPPVHTATERTAAHAAPRGAPAAGDAQQAGAGRFQEALALELGAEKDELSTPAQALAPALATRRGSANTEDNKAAATAATDALASVAAAGLPALAPALTLLDPAVDATSTVSREALLPAPSRASHLSRAPRLPRDYGAAAASALGPTPDAADANQRVPDSASAAPRTGAQAALDATADFAATGKFAPLAESTIRREAAFAAGLLDQHQNAPASPQAGNPAPGAAATPPVALALPGLALEARVGERGWDRDLGDKLVWMAGNKRQTAQLRLNPPDLGPLEISLTLSGDDASAQFVSAHAAVREALEAAMPQLREMLADSGIILGEASVSADAFHGQAQPQHEGRAYPAADLPAESADADAAAERSSRAPLRVQGLVDTYA